MCKVLALSALLANSDVKANTIASTVVSTASAFSTADNAVPTHGGGTMASQEPNAEPPVHT